jgi:hypothetical protein
MKVTTPQGKTRRGDRGERSRVQELGDAAAIKKRVSTLRGVSAYQV